MSKLPNTVRSPSLPVGVALGLLGEQRLPGGRKSAVGFAEGFWVALA